jgi:hypothetical protein
MIAIGLAATVVAVGACSFNVQGLDPKWDGSSEPVCKDTSVMVDRIVGAAFLIAGISALSANRDVPGLVVGGPTIGIGALFLLSGATGAASWAQCQAARTRWLYSNAIKARAPAAAVAGSGAARAQPTGAPAAGPAAPPAPPHTGPADIASPSIPAGAAPGPAGHHEDRPWAAGVSGHEQTAALALYVDGNREFVQARYAQALAKYHEAIRHWDHPAIRFNMAVCQINLGQPVDARDNLERSLAYGAAALGPEAYAQGQTYRKLLDPQLVRLTLDCPEPDEEVVLDGKLVFKGPGVVDRFELPGEHQLIATKPGFLPASRKIVLVAGQPATYEIRPLVDPRPRP